MPITAEQQREIQDRTLKQEETKLDPDKMEFEEATPEVKPEAALSAIEKQARDDGWVPYEEWDGNPDDWVDAKEFNLRGELMGRIKKQSNFINSLKGEVDQMKTALKELGEHNKKIAQEERKKALKELKAARREALEDRDYDTLEEVEERMDELKSVDLDKETPEVEVEQPQGIDPAVQAWLDTNPWYQTDPVLQGATNAVIQSIIAEDPAMESDPQGLLEEATKRVKKELPHKFGTEDLDEEEEETPKAPRKQVAEPTNRSPSKSGRKQKYTSRDLNDEQRKIGKVFVDSGAFETLDEYAADLAKIGELDAQQGV